MASRGFHDRAGMYVSPNDDDLDVASGGGRGSRQPAGQLEMFGLSSSSQGMLPLGEKELPEIYKPDPGEAATSLKGIDKEKELEVWRRYRSGDRGAFRDLLNGGAHGPGYRGMLYGSPIGRRYLGDAPLPKSAIKAELLSNFKRALDTYEEGKGAALGSWVWTNLQKTSRYVITYNQVAKIPEGRISKVRTFNVARDELESMLGRDPSDRELASKLGWDESDVALTRTEARKDIMMQEGLDEAPDEGALTDALDLIHYVHPTLDPEAKRVIEYTYGLFGHQEIPDNNDLAERLGTTANRIRAIKRKIAREIQKHRR